MDSTNPTQPNNPIPAAQSPAAGSSTPPSSPGASTSPSPQPTTTQPTTPPTQPDWVQHIPEAYRSNPEKLREAFEFEKYGRAIRPYHQAFETFQNDYQAFQEWRKQNPPGQPQRNPATGRFQPQAAPTAQTSASEPEIDWDDPDATRKAYERQQQMITGHVETFQQEMQRLRDEMTQARDTTFELLRIQQGLRDIRDRELWGHVKFQPKTDPQKLAQFMLENNINDADKAHELLYGKQNWDAERQQLQAEAQQRYEQGKQDAERELANRIVTTETSTGTPWRLRTEGRSQLPANSRQRRQEIADKAAARIGMPREFVD